MVSYRKKCYVHECIVCAATVLHDNYCADPNIHTKHTIYNLVHKKKKKKHLEWSECASTVFNLRPPFEALIRLRLLRFLAPATRLPICHLILSVTIT